MFTATAFRDKMRDTEPDHFETRHAFEPLSKKLENALEAYAKLEEYNSILSLEHPFWVFGATLENYHKKKQALLHQQFALIDEMEHLVYAWYAKHQISYESPDHLPFGRAFFTLLDELQTEHIKLVNETVRNGFNIWLPDQYQMNDTEYESLQSFWQNLIRNKTNLSLNHTCLEHDAEATEEFKLAHYSNWAKIMSRPFGRWLLREIAAFPNKVEIKPLTSVHDEDRCSPQTLNDDPKMGRAHSRQPFNESFPVPNVVEPSPEGGIASTITFNHKDQSIINGRFYAGNDWLVDDPPEYKTVPTVMIPNDPELKPDRLKGSITFTTPFINLGHELGHAYHFQRGMGLALIYQEIFKRRPKWKYWTSLEEYAIINFVENEMRKEHGIPPRFFHLTTPKSFSDFLV
ncbi:hypothetical protein [Aureibacter tunicatorum]|uniref:Uncharacterized protein n=1 Tax=Aureibacter tunicatorum TaxID=866807 RepID=A0AAE3XMK3_9BACT|nr:hypothetical protein [Aureibacter tunicatorum]MDR6239212.1 hypothetical protein [Aureibacter tunicatorum]BDD04862.1 hypothetical protein AUTU_23450 [Aureibacter tunicatorum]